MNELRRITTVYDAQEDRIRLVGEIEAGETVVLWLTRRLLDRLIPQLTGWLEHGRKDMPRADLMLGFAQQAAEQGLAPQPPVPAWRTSLQWRVDGVDLHFGEEELRLVFKSVESDSAAIGLAATPLRQWLGILQRGYRQAEWPLDRWPSWMREETVASAPAGVAMVLH